MKYFDEEYDGLIVKLPNWFIELNGLEQFVDQFKHSIEEKSTMSLLFGDYENTLYELENYKNKKEFVKDRLEKKKIEEKKKDEYYKPRINKEIFDIEFKEKTQEFFNNQIILGKERFDEEYFWSKGKTPNRKKIQEVNDRISELSDDEFSKFIYDNRIFFTHGLTYGIHWKRVDLNIYMDRHGILMFRIELMCIKWWVNNYEFYKNIFILHAHNEDYLYFILPSRKGGEIKLSDYEIKGNILIKKQI